MKLKLCTKEKIADTHSHTEKYHLLKHAKKPYPKIEKFQENKPTLIKPIPQME